MSLLSFVPFHNRNKQPESTEIQKMFKKKHIKIQQFLFAEVENIQFLLSFLVFHFDFFFIFNFILFYYHAMRSLNPFQLV